MIACHAHNSLTWWVKGPVLTILLLVLVVLCVLLWDMRGALRG